MERRTFMRTGLALGAAGLGGQFGVADLSATPTGRADGPIRLNSNENPLGLSPAARQAVIDGLPEANRYPSEKRRELIDALAAKHGVQSQNIVLGNGSTEILQMMVQATATRRATLILPDPTFEHAPRYGGPEGIRIEAVPLTSDLAHDVARMRELAERSWDPVLVYVCNPNNPTGTLTSCRDIDAWIADAPENVRFMVDEAYFEYANSPEYWTATKWIGTHPNVVVVRTFSKIFAMAGMRLGYGIMHATTAVHMRRFMSGSNANELALRAGLASLRDRGLIGRSLETNTRAKEILYAVLNDLDLEYVPTHANFVMHRINADLNTYRQRMREQDIHVGRPFPPMLDHNRLSLGTPQEMERFADVLKGFRQKGWA